MFFYRLVLTVAVFEFDLAFYYTKTYVYIF